MQTDFEVPSPSLSPVVSRCHRCRFHLVRYLLANVDHPIYKIRVPSSRSEGALLTDLILTPSPISFLRPTCYIWTRTIVPYSPTGYFDSRVNLHSNPQGIFTSTQLSFSLGPVTTTCPLPENLMNCSCISRGQPGPPHPLPMCWLTKQFKYLGMSACITQVSRGTFA